MSEASPQNSTEIIIQAFNRCKNRIKRACLYAAVSNGLFLFLTLYSLQMIDRVIGSGHHNTLALLTLIMTIGILLCYLICLLVVPQILLYYDVKRYSKWFNSKNSLHTNQHLPNSLDNDLIKLNSTLSSPSVSIVMDMIWWMLSFIILLMIHPYIAYAAIAGVIIVSGFAYIKIITTNQYIREVSEYSSTDSKLYYIIQQISEFGIMTTLGGGTALILACVLNIGYSWFDFYILNRALKLSNKSYNNSNLSKFYRFLKSFLTINIKMICGGFIVGVVAYIVTSTSGRDLSTGGMLAGYIIAVRMLILADNIVIIWPNIRNTYKAYSNLSNLARGSIS